MCCNDVQSIISESAVRYSTVIISKCVVNRLPARGRVGGWQQGLLCAGAVVCHSVCRSEGCSAQARPD